MTWQEKILLGMKLIKAGCGENQSGELCLKECPFWEACKKGSLPEEWEID